MQRYYDRPARVEALIRKLGEVHLREASPLAKRETCEICHNKLEEAHNVNFLPNCGHAFHADCLRYVWLKPQETLGLVCFSCGASAEPQETLGGARFYSEFDF